MYQPLLPGFLLGFAGFLFGLARILLGFALCFVLVAVLVVANRAFDVAYGFVGFALDLFFLPLACRSLPSFCTALSARAVGTKVSVKSAKGNEK